MGTYLIARRELVSYLMSATGWLILGVVLLAQGLLFNAVAMAGDKKSFDVLQPLPPQVPALSAVMTDVLAELR